MSVRLIIVNSAGRIASMVTVPDEMADRYKPANPAHSVYRTSHAHARELRIKGAREIPADDSECVYIPPIIEEM